MKEVVTLALIGDVMLSRGVNQEIAYRSPESFWGSTLPLLRAADAPSLCAPFHTPVSKTAEGLEVSLAEKMKPLAVH
jgi:hypothetical protein